MVSTGQSALHRAGGTFSVRDLTAGIQQALAAWFPNEVWVQGRIVNLSRSAAGHVYFQLADADPDQPEASTAPEAAIAVTLFDSARQHVNAVLRQAGGVRMTDGMQICIRGRVELYPVQGRVQLRMSGIDPDYTLGLIANQRERVLRTLAEEGLLERNKRHRVPLGPLRVGLVTAPASAAMADFLHELEVSGVPWSVLHAPSRVQGNGAARDLIAALERVSAHDVHAVALVRGGGARTDLAVFDDEALARTIAHLPVAVFTGIGHEVDTSVADAVAHTACKTPTACASHLVDLVAASAQRAEQAWLGIATSATRSIERHGHEVERRRTQLLHRSARRIERERDGLDARHARLGREARTTLERAALRLERDAARAAALDPARQLERGWSITRTAQGHVVRDPSELVEGDLLDTTVQGGTVRSVVAASAEPGDRSR